MPLSNADLRRRYADLITTEMDQAIDAFAEELVSLGPRMPRWASQELYRALTDAYLRWFDQTYDGPPDREP